MSDNASPPSSAAGPTARSAHALHHVSRLDCALLLAAPGIEPARRDVRISMADGLVSAVEQADAAGLASDGVTASSPRRLAMPALSNAHDHARTFRSSTVGAFGQPLETWLPFMGVVPGLDPYLCAATSFARSVRRGVANLMVHYTRVQGGMPFVDEVRDVARAARDVGVRIAFAVAMRDRQGIAYCDDASVLAALRPGIRDAVSKRLSTRVVDAVTQLAVVDDVAAMIREDGHSGRVNVQYGPAAVQWCSTPLLEAIARASADTGRGVHMHLLETPYQREWADKVHPEGIVRFLDSIGLLSPRLTLAHCTWARPEELALLAERGVTIAVNTSSNLGLKSGIAPMEQMLALGCKVAMGLDGAAFDEDDDALRELRLAHALHRGWGHEEALRRDQLSAFGSTNGRRSVNGLSPSALDGCIAVGAAADIMTLDWEEIDDERLFDDIDPFDQLLGRATGAHVDKVIIDGLLAVDGGRVLGIDEAASSRELLRAARAALASDPSHEEWRRTVRLFAEDLAPFYKHGAWLGCC